MTMISFHVPCNPTINSYQSKNVSIINCSSNPNHIQIQQSTSKNSNRRSLLSKCIIISTTFFSFSGESFSLTPTNSSEAIAKFFEIPNSGGVKALDLRFGTGPTPIDGDQVRIGSEYVLFNLFFKLMIFLLNFVFDCRFMIFFINDNLKTIFFMIVLYFLIKLFLIASIDPNVMIKSCV